MANSGGTTQTFSKLLLMHDICRGEMGKFSHAHNKLIAITKVRVFEWQWTQAASYAQRLVATGA